MEKKVVVLTSTEYNNTIPLIQVVKKMVDNNMIPIFGVTKNVENLYKDLAGKKHIFQVLEIFWKVPQIIKCL